MAPGDWERGADGGRPDPRSRRRAVAIREGAREWILDRSESEVCTRKDGMMDILLVILMAIVVGLLGLSEGWW